MPRDEITMISRNFDFSMEAIRMLCQRYQVRELAVFGSALRDDFTATNDVDLLVEFEPEAQVGFLTLSRV